MAPMISIRAYSGGRPEKLLLEHMLSQMGVQTGDSRPRLVVNWGLSGAFPCTTLNIPGFDKLTELQILARHDIPVPRFVISTIPPYLPRTRAHQCAADFRNLPHADYWTEYISCEAEYRVHAFRGELLALAIKVATGQAHPWIRNHHYGWNFSYLSDYEAQSSSCKRVVKAGIRAVEVLGLDFGAVDVGVHNGSPVVFEVNRAPGLIESTARKYAEAIKNVYDTYT